MPPPPLTVREQTEAEVPFHSDDMSVAEKNVAEEQDPYKSTSIVEPIRSE